MYSRGGVSEPGAHLMLHAPLPFIDVIFAASGRKYYSRIRRTECSSDFTAYDFDLIGLPLLCGNRVGTNHEDHYFIYWLRQLSAEKHSH